MRISDWSSDVCSSGLAQIAALAQQRADAVHGCLGQAAGLHQVGRAQGMVGTGDRLENLEHPDRTGLRRQLFLPAYRLNPTAPTAARARSAGTRSAGRRRTIAGPCTEACRYRYL